MTEQSPSNSSDRPKSPIRRWTLPTARPTYLAWVLGGGLILAGIEWPTNWPLIISGSGILFLAYILEKYTRFGKEGPVILREEATIGADGKIERLRYSTGIFTPANFLRFVGIVIAATGLLWPLNWAMMLTGFGLAGVGLYLGRQKEASAGLYPAYTTLQKVGDEIRSEKGYVVRRVEMGLQYSEGAHAVTLRSDQISIQVVDVPHPDGGVTKRKVVNIEAGHFRVHWDSPNENQPISLERLFEISSRMSEALNSGKVFYANR
jgi:membrane protein implicated in regulation of membrane protease activity